MLMNAMRQGALGGLLKFVIFGFLILAVGGMVFMDIGGFFRSGGVGSTDVARIGKDKISLPSFDRNLRRSLAQLGITPQDAYKGGYVDQILGGEIRARLMEQAGNELDISVDQKRVAMQIKNLLGPMVKPGDDPRDVLRQLLAAQGLSEGELAHSIGREITMELLNGTIQSGFANIPESLVQDLYAYENEKRDVVFVAFPDSDIKSSVEPSDEQLQKLYDATKEGYATPETRVLQIVKINTDTIKKSLELDEAEIRDNYENNIDLYTEKEQRTLDQALFDKQEKAKAVVEAVKSGKSLQNAVKEITQRDSDYLGERTSETASLPPEIREIVAASTHGEVVGPLKTDIGYQVILVKKVVPAKVKSFESVKKEIREEILDNKAIDQQYDLASQVEDMLAGGASLEDVKKDIDIAVTTLPEINSYGLGSDGKDALAAYEALKPVILEQGFQLGQGETSPMAENADGSFSGIHVASVKAKTYKSFAEVKPAMLKRWMFDQARMENKLEATKTLEEIRKAKQSPDDFAKSKNKTLQARSDISRKVAPPQPFNERTWGSLFEATPNDPFILDIEGGTAIAWITKTEQPEKIDVTSKDYKDFKESLLNNTKQEAFLMYGQYKAEKIGARINQKLLDQVYGQPNEPQ